MENLTHVSFATSWKCLSEGRNGGVDAGGFCVRINTPSHACVHRLHTQAHTHTSVLNHHCCLELSRGAQ